jgi:transaldolase
MDIVSNILEMYKAMGDGHVQVLTASVRTMEHMLDALFIKSHCITAPGKIIEQWVSAGKPIPQGEYIYDIQGVADVPYRELTLDLEWREYDLHHDLTDAGVNKFWEDWSSIVG